jgi:CRP-like cAMP-binding protein
MGPMTETRFDVDVIAAGESTILKFAEGGVIFAPGDAADCAYIVKSGKVEMREKGRSVERLEPGEIFGELALIDAEPRSASAVAVGSVELIPISRSLFDVLIRDDSDFALTIVRLMAKSLRATMKMLKTYIEDAADEKPRARA